jgi:hypothetical protein
MRTVTRAWTLAAVGPWVGGAEVAIAAAAASQNMTRP